MQTGPYQRASNIEFHQGITSFILALVTANAHYQAYHSTIFYPNLSLLVQHLGTDITYRYRRS